MSFVKDLWMDEVEAIAERLMDEGVAEEDAYERAYESAQQAVADRLADAADFQRKRAREEGF